MKKVYVLIVLILGSITLNHFFYSPDLIELISGNAAAGFSLNWPLFRLFIEPFYAFSYYILTLERSGYVFALISWTFWIFSAFMILSWHNKCSFMKALVYCSWAFLFFVSLICMVIILPVSGPKLKAPDSYKVFDMHSHTIASKDSISNVMSSIKYHKKHGFTDFFITEHDNTKGFYSIPYDVDINNIFPGIQIRTKDGISILLLSRHQFVYKEFEGKTIEEMVSLAHKKGMLVVVPHWWKWNRPSLEALSGLGIDGFEIYNCGYRYLSDEKRREMIDICKQNNLMMFGSTDWHGLGYMTNVWSVVDCGKNKEECLFDILKVKPEIKIIVHDIKGSQSVIRYVFEPFYAFYLYITHSGFKYILSFFMAASVVFLLFLKFRCMKIVRIVSLIFSFFFAGVLFYFTYILSFNLMTSVIIPETIIPAGIGLTILWLVIWGISGKNT